LVVGPLTGLSYRSKCRWFIGTTTCSIVHSEFFTEI